MHTHQQAVLDGLTLEDSGVPIYVQLRDQLLRALGAGVLGPGAQMPTMRQVAVALKIDLNTARRAYDELERMGAIELARGRGSFVSQAPPRADPVLLTRQTDNLANQVIATAAATGIDPVALARRITALSQAAQSQPGAEQQKGETQ